MATRSTTTALKLSLLVPGMFAFAFVMVPMYDLLCEVTGLGGRTGDAYVYEPATIKVDSSRLVKVNFLTGTNDGMPWGFWAQSSSVRVHPGELTVVNFFVKNPTDRVMVAQAIPSLAPGNAAEYFHKTECFCFERQVLQPGEELEMPMRFMIAPELPAYLQTVSLSYSLFDITELAAAGSTRPDA